jgi:hypothetical protein
LAGMTICLRPSTTRLLPYATWHQFSELSSLTHGWGNSSEWLTNKPKCKCRMVESGNAESRSTNFSGSICGLASARYHIPRANPAPGTYYHECK